jgi:hypothetical protein
MESAIAAYCANVNFRAVLAAQQDLAKGAFALPRLKNLRTNCPQCGFSDPIGMAARGFLQLTELEARCPI